MAATGHRIGVAALLGTAAATALVGGVAVVILNSGGDTEETLVPESTVAATALTTESVVTTEGLSDEAIAADDEFPMDEPPLRALPPMGIDSAVFDWTVAELGESNHGEMWINQLVEVDGSFWAIGGSYDEMSDREVSFVFISTDGVDWQRSELPEEISQAGHPQLTATDSGVVAIVNGWDAVTDRPEMSVFVSVDGETWVESSPASLVTTGETMWLNHVAASGGTIVLAGASEEAPPPHEPLVITIERDGYLIELDEANWSYLVTDKANGEAVAFGSQEDLWGHEDDGRFGIYDAASDEMVFQLTWEELDAAATTTYESATWGEPMQIRLTSGDRTMTIDEFSGAVSVTDATGAVLFKGTERDMWQGPPPTFRDRNGNVLVVVPWDEWEAAHGAAYDLDGHDVYSATPIMMRSTDGGVSWETVDLWDVAPANFSFQSVVGGQAGFVAIGTTEPSFEDHACDQSIEEPAVVVLTSRDGVAWVERTNNLRPRDWLGTVTATGDGYVAVRSGEQTTSEVVASVDGATWLPVLNQDDLELEMGQVWFDRVAAGQLGTFAIGTYDGHSQPDQVSAELSQAGRTLSIEGPIYTVIDDDTSTVLYSYDESTVTHCEEFVGAPASGFKWGQGGLVIFDDEGAVIFAASHRRYEEAMSAMWAEPIGYYESEQVLLYQAEQAWLRVPLPPGLGPHLWFGGAVVTDEGVVLVATSETHSDVDFTVTNLAVVGVPIEP